MESERERLLWSVLSQACEMGIGNYWGNSTDLFEWKKNQPFLLVVDYYSRYIEIAKLNQQTARRGNSSNKVCAKSFYLLVTVFLRC